MSLFLEEFTNEEVKKIAEQDKESKVQLVGFCHNIRPNKRMIFVVLRKGTQTIQLIVFNDGTDAFNIFNKINIESTVHVTGVIVPAKVKTCTCTNYEIKVIKVEVISLSKQQLPFSLEDANETFHQGSLEDAENAENTMNENDENQRCKVGRKHRLDFRWLDLRGQTNQYIFILRSKMEESIRLELSKRKFIEIHTPKIIKGSSEGGSEVFKLDYHEQKACLAQSPQLCKQMVVNSGFEKVFEFGPIFRAEKASSYRHLCEFTGFDMEFVIKPIESHIEIIGTVWAILYNAVLHFERIMSNEIENVLDKTKTLKLVFPEKPLVLNFKQGVELLRERGFVQDGEKDIGSVNEKHLGNIIKEKYGSDVYVLAEYPESTRPFYTMLCEDKKYTKSFDFMMRGNEISSGAQRIHNSAILKERILAKGITLNDESGLEHYVESFETGSMPHGGCGIGMERLLALYLGLGNIRTTSLFPRDHVRLTP